MSSPTESIRAALDRVENIEARAKRLDEFGLPLPLWAEEARTLLPRFAKALEIALDNIESVDLRAHAEREIARLLEER